MIELKSVEGRKGNSLRCHLNAAQPPRQEKAKQHQTLKANSCPQVALRAPQLTNAAPHSESGECGHRRRPNSIELGRTGADIGEGDLGIIR
jgi:hypothetical protein